MITPLDIENKKFSKQMMSGYNVEEVDEFLDQVMQDYESNYKEVVSLKNKVDELNNALNHYKTIEATLQNTLVMAQSTAEEVKNVAKQQADQIIKDAESDAKQSLASLEQQILLKKKDFEDLQKQFDVYKAKMESLLISQLELIKDINKEQDN